MNAVATAPHTIRAADLTEDMIFDLEPLALAYAPNDYALMAAVTDTYATCDGPSTPAEPVNNEEAVVLYTDQANFKVPANHIIELAMCQCCETAGASNHAYDAYDAETW